jgi:hypothetical protein
MLISLSLITEDTLRRHSMMPHYAIDYDAYAFDAAADDAIFILMLSISHCHATLIRFRLFSLILRHCRLRRRR